jgi:hypothetical protein
MEQAPYRPSIKFKIRKVQKQIKTHMPVCLYKMSSGYQQQQ